MKQSPNIVVIDYESGNLRSVAKALEFVGVAPLVTGDPRLLAAADGAILPGVGSAPQAMAALQARNLVEPIQAYVSTGRPFLGVCLGLQLLLDRTEEGDAPCLGIVPGTVKRLQASVDENPKTPQTGTSAPDMGPKTEDAGLNPPQLGLKARHVGLKVPHMGWNSVDIRRPHPMLVGIAPGSRFYFVHSYYAAPDQVENVAGATDYGVTFCSILARDNLVATQFHPEKSGPVGLRIYQNFAALCAGRAPAEDYTPAAGPNRRARG